MRAAAWLMLGVMVTGCGAGWHRVSLGPEGSFNARQQVQVWANGSEAGRLHGVSWTQDTVLGRYYLDPLDCDSCERVVLPRASVDSVRTGNPTAGLFKSAGVVLGTIVVVGIVACLGTRSCNWGD
jgi:hypothetical protein